MDPKALITQGDQLFGKRGTLMSFWQETGEHLYPERADFTTTRSVGTNYADNLTSSYPVILRRELGDLFSTMLRPTSLEWFHATTDQDEDEHAAKQWLEAKSKIMRRAMYDPGTLFTRATKEGDHDFAAFGNAVITVELDLKVNKLLYRCWHLRDVAWADDVRGKSCTVHRKWKSTPAEQAKIFPGKIHPKVQEKLTGSNADPWCAANVRHIVMPAEDYTGEYRGKGRSNVKYVSIFIDTDNQHLIEAVGQTYMMYVIPRWQTVSGSQYGFSPAAGCAVPEARLYQAMSATLLEAGEKATNPPMIGVGDALRGDLALYAGGFTSVDADYDERLGEVVRQLPLDKNGIPYGMEMRRELIEVMREAFYLNKLTMPQNGPEMTAYEVGQRIQEYIRAATPVFEPVEASYNGAICETTFELMLSAGGFGSVEDIPESLSGADVRFRFESPLHDAIEKQKTQQFVEAKAIIADTLALDPSFDAHIDITTAGRDVLGAIVPAKWLRSQADADGIIEERKAQQESEALIAQIQAGATAAEQVGKAGQALNPALAG